MFSNAESDHNDRVSAEVLTAYVGKGINPCTQALKDTYLSITWKGGTQEPVN